MHESMIPEWMDLVVWGHEHECQVGLRYFKPGLTAVGLYIPLFDWAVS